MISLIRNGIVLLLLIASTAWANPYWNPQRVARDKDYALPNMHYKTADQLENDHTEASKVRRISINWNPANESYTYYFQTIENSGTPALLARSRTKPKWGSYLGVLVDTKTQQPLYYDAIGTGKEYRKLTRTLSFRFPNPDTAVTFELYAENPQSGVMEKVLTKELGISVSVFPESFPTVKLLSPAKTFPSLRINIYADGYLNSEEARFWEDAQRTVQTLQKVNFPGVDSMSFYGVFAPSNKKLGAPKDLGLPVKTYDSNLGLYYAYWAFDGRWYNVVYPTDENYFRYHLGLAAYDYALVLINDNHYWGVGNYMSFTAIPARNDTYFTYLLVHEFGHFFGLNEEYEGGGPTELEFAPDMKEAWSPNITFVPEKSSLKWRQFVKDSTPVPTSNDKWQSNPPVYGAYIGGYGDSKNTNGKSHKPGFDCVMEAKKHFCDICKDGIQQVISYSLGKDNQAVSKR